MLEQDLLKVANKLDVLVRYDGFGESIEFEYLVEKDLGDFRCSGNGMQWHEVGSFGETVYKNYNGVMAFSR